MKILFYLFFPSGGIGYYTHCVLAEFATRADTQVELACVPSYHWRQQATYPTWPGLREISHSHPWLRKTNFLLGQFINPVRVCHRAASTGVDILHLCNITYLSYAYWRGLRDRSGARLVATVHTVRRNSALVNHQYESRQLRRVYGDADALLVHSEAQAMDLVMYAGIDRHKIHVVPHGPSEYGAPHADRATLRARYGLPQDKQISLFFGDIRPDKNLDLMLRAMVPYRDRLHLLVAGRGDRSGRRGAGWYKSLAGQLGLSGHVLFLDHYIPDDEVPDLFELSDWVALPYSRSFTSQSGVLNVATRYRRPVLASSSPTLAETIQNSDIGLLVEADALEALKDGIGAICDRVNERYPHNFEAYNSHFTWQRNVERTLSVYQSIIGTAAPTSNRSPATAASPTLGGQPETLL